MATISDLLTVAKAQIGKPYVYGAEGPGSFDCSGLTQYVYGALGISIPRTAAQQQAAATPVSSPQPGDLVFWGAPAYHVALYVGDGYQVAAPEPGQSVTVQKVWGSPTYGRIASLGTDGIAATAASLGGTVQQASWSVDGFFGQVEGVTLTLVAAGLGLALVGVGVWRMTQRAQDKLLAKATGGAG